MISTKTICLACNCDQYGSLDVQCDIVSGQCPCKENFMGQRCDLCEENKYRDGFECPSMSETNVALLDAPFDHLQLVHHATAKCKNVSIATDEI